MDALKAYISTCRLVFYSEADDADAWASISKHFVCLRKALTCNLCEKILSAPRSSSISECQHCVCRSCVSKKMKFQPHCDCSNDPTKFTENYQIRILLNCFQSLCEYIINSSLLYKWGHLNGGKNNTLGDIVQEGVELERDLGLNSTCPSTSAGITVPNYESATEIDTNHGSTGYNGTISNGNCSSYNVPHADSSTKLLIKRTLSDDIEPSDKQDQLSDFVFKKPSMTVSMMRSFRLKKKGCRCGLATNNPGKLTCCGQRCPCYVEGKACSQCKCRGCRNPHKFVSKYRNTSCTISNSQSEVGVEIKREKETVESKNNILHKNHQAHNVN